MYKIYRITNQLNNKSYVGLTKQTLQQRFNQHANKRLDTVSAIKDAIRKYGKDNFIIEELTTCDTLDEAYQSERIAIRFYNTQSPNGYNIHIGGTGGKFTEEMKEKMSIAMKEHWLNSTHPMQGKTHTEEARQKIRDSKIGKVFLSGEKHHWYGKSISELPFNKGLDHTWNKGVPMKEESKRKRNITKFYKFVEKLLNEGLEAKIISSEEVSYMQGKLSDGHFDVIVGFFITKRQDLVYGHRDKSRAERDMLINLNRKFKVVYRTHERIKELLKEVI